MPLDGILLPAFVIILWFCKDIVVSLYFIHRCQCMIEKHQIKDFFCDVIFSLRQKHAVDRCESSFMVCVLWPDNKAQNKAWKLDSK